MSTRTRSRRLWSCLSAFALCAAGGTVFAYGDGWSATIAPFKLELIAAATTLRVPSNTSAAADIAAWPGIRKVHVAATKAIAANQPVSKAEASKGETGRDDRSATNAPALRFESVTRTDSVPSMAAPASDTSANPYAKHDDASPPPGNTAPRLDLAAAIAALSASAALASRCGAADLVRTRFGVTFAPAGNASLVAIEGKSPLVGRDVGHCVARVLLGAKVSPFAGEPATVHFSILTPR